MVFRDCLTINKPAKIIKIVGNIGPTIEKVSNFNATTDKTFVNRWVTIPIEIAIKTRFAIEAFLSKLTTNGNANIIIPKRVKGLINLPIISTTNSFEEILLSRLNKVN